MLVFNEKIDLNEGCSFYTLDGAIQAYRMFKEFQDFALRNCGGDDGLGDALDEVQEIIEDLIKVRNTRDFSHVVSDDKVLLGDGQYEAIWREYNITIFKNDQVIRVSPSEDNMNTVRITKEHPKVVTLRVDNGVPRVFGYDIY